MTNNIGCVREDQIVQQHGNRKPGPSAHTITRCIISKVGASTMDGALFNLYRSDTIKKTIAVYMKKSHYVDVLFSIIFKFPKNKNKK